MRDLRKSCLKIHNTENQEVVARSDTVHSLESPVMELDAFKDHYLCVNALIYHFSVLKQLWKEIPLRSPLNEWKPLLPNWLSSCRFLI